MEISVLFIEEKEGDFNFLVVLVLSCPDEEEKKKKNSPPNQG